MIIHGQDKFDLLLLYFNKFLLFTTDTGIGNVSP